MARTPLLRAFERLAEEHAPPSGSASRRQSCAGSARRPPSPRRVPQARRRRRGRLRGRSGACSAHARRPTATAPADRDRRRRHRRPECRAALAGQGFASTIYEASTDRIGGRMHSDTSGYWANGQVSEFCGELIDTGHKTIRRLAKRFNLPTVDLLAAQPSGTDRHVLVLRQRTTRSPRPTRTSSRSTRRSRPAQGGRLSDDVRELNAGGATVRRDVGLRLDRELRSRRPRLADGPAARRRLQRGVRRRDEGPGVAQPHLPARLPAEPRRLSRSSAPRTSGSTSAAATSGCRRRSRTTSAARTSSRAGRCSRSGRTRTARSR